MNWFEKRGARTNFEKHILPELAGQKCRYLEIGTWNGDSVVWVLENILTHPRSSAVIVDPWLAMRKTRTSSQELVDKAYETAMGRLKPYRRKVAVYRQPSSVWLRQNDFQHHTFDFIYLDGDHVDLAVMDDAVLCWPLLKVGGFMVFDDFNLGEWHRTRNGHHVRHAVRGFMKVYGNGYAEKLFGNYQYGIRKIGDATMAAHDQNGQRRRPGLSLKPEVFA